MKTKIYILTHKKFDYEFDDFYEPLLNGSALLSKDYGYTRDDTGENISELNPFYAELTGEYWAWKNSDADIIGFCHYRRYFFKNIFMNKLEKKEIENILNEYDVILPKKMHSKNIIIESIGWDNKRIKIYGDSTHKPSHTREDYLKLRKIIEEKSPEYLEFYDKMLNSKESYCWNMLICRKEIYDDYCDWLFKILKEFKEQTDFSTYKQKNKRVLGYLSEKLLTTYFIKNDFKVKEKPVFQLGLRVPIATAISNRFPIMQTFFNEIIYLEEKLRKH